MAARTLSVVGLCVALALGACGGDSGEPPAPGGEPSATQPPAPSEDAAAKAAGATGEKRRDRSRRPAGIEITTADSPFGEILFDADRRAIYLFDKEAAGESECYGDCAAAWPPVLTKGEPEATGAVKGKLLGTTERDDGELQVTYDGRPLYYYVDDPRGEVLCHNVFEFGGLWLVLEPSGQAVA